MASEITVTTTLGLNNNGLRVSPSFTHSADQTTPGALSRKQTITTSTPQTVAFTGLTTPRWVLLKNNDATNYITLGPDSTGMVAFAVLLAGESMLFPASSTVTIKAQAHSGSCDLLISALET
jgi:hypothetical protein